MRTDPKTPPLAYRVPDACKAVGIGRTLLCDLIKAGTITPVRVGGRVLIPHAELEKLIARD